MSQRDRYNRGGIGRWYWDFRDRQVMKICQGSKFLKNFLPILDVGCGDMITTRKMGAIGMDLDRGDIKGSVYSIPCHDESFACVTLLEVIEHLERPWHAIIEIRRVLRPGGRVIILFPNDRTFKIAWFLTGMWGEIRRDRGHLKQWYPWMAAYLLENCGFKVVAQESIPFHIWSLSLHHIIVGEKC